MRNDQTAQRLRALAKRTALDGIGEELLAIANELDAAQRRSDAGFLELAEFVGLIGPGSRVGDSHNAIVRFGRVLTQALATTEPVAERDLLRRILANHDGAMGLIGARMRAAGVSNMTIHGEEGGYFGQAYSLMEEARALLACTVTTECKGEPISPTSGNILVDAFNEVQALKQQHATTERKGDPVAWWYDTKPHATIETTRLDHTFIDRSGEYIKGRALVFGDTSPQVPSYMAGLSQGIAGALHHLMLMIAGRAQAFPSFPMGSCLPEVFDAAGVEMPPLHLCRAPAERAR